MGKGPLVRLMLTKGQYIALGHMIAQWAYLESQINTEIAWLLKRREHAGKRVNYQAKFSTRVTNWQTLADKSFRYRPDLMRQVNKVAGHAVAKKRDRDKLAHGTIAKSGLFLHYHAGELIKLDDTIGKAKSIQQLAYDIAAITFDLAKHQRSLMRFKNRP